MIVFFIVIAAIVLLCFLIFTLFFTIYNFVPMLFWGAPYVVTDQERVKKIINLLNIRPGDKAVDLGSGDGRLVIAMVQAGAEAHGYEINPFLVLIAKNNIREAGLKNKAFIHWKSFWNEDFSRFNVVTVFGTSYMMKKLETKLQKELKSGARIASSAFTFPSWVYSKKKESIYLYERKSVNKIKSPRE